MVWLVKKCHHYWKKERIQFSSLSFRRKGSFNNYVDRILPFSDPPPSPACTVFMPWALTKKKIFFDPHVVIEWPLSIRLLLWSGASCWRMCQISYGFHCHVKLWNKKKILYKKLEQLFSRLEIWARIGIQLGSKEDHHFSFLKDFLHRIRFVYYLFFNKLSRWLRFEWCLSILISWSPVQ